MEWGFAIQAPSKRDPVVKLDKYVTHGRNLASSMWKPSLANPERRCLVPFTHFAGPHPEGGTGDDGGGPLGINVEATVRREGFR